MVQLVFHNQKSFVVGNPDLFDEYQRLIAHRLPMDSSPLELSTPMDASQMLVVRDIVAGVDVNNDGYADAIEGRAFRIGYGTENNPYKWVTFTSIFFGSKENEYVVGASPVLPEHADITSAFEGINFYQSDYTYWENSAKLIVENRDQNFFDKQVSYALYSVMTFCYNSLGYFQLIEVVAKKYLSEAKKYRLALDSAIKPELSFALESLGRWSQEETEPLYQKAFSNMLKEFYDFHPELEDLSRASERQNLSQSIIYDQQCDGRYKRILEKMEELKLPLSKLSSLTRLAVLTESQIMRGGLFDPNETGFVAKANEYAVSHGYRNYAEMRMMEYYGLTVEEYKKFAYGILERNIEQNKKIIREMNIKLNISGPIWDINANTLIRQMRELAFKELGLENEPTLSVKEAMSVAKKFYRDIGFDLDALPYQGRIVFDLYARKEKDGGFGGGMGGDGKACGVFMHFDPEKKLTLYDLNVLIHEIAHSLHSIYGSKYARGSSLIGTAYVERLAPALSEGIAKGFGEIVYKRKWIDTYLADIEGFTREDVRQTLSKEYQQEMFYLDSRLLALTLWEINLYEEYDESGTYKSMFERLNFWKKLCVKYLSHEDIDIDLFDGSLRPAGTPHLTWRSMYLSSYTSGMVIRDIIAQNILSALSVVNSSLRSSHIQPIKDLMEKGGQISSLRTSETILKEGL